MDQPAQRIEVTPDGPYLVYGRVPVTRRRPVSSEHDEPLTWQTTDRLRTGDDRSTHPRLTLSSAAR